MGRRPRPGPKEGKAAVRRNWEASKRESHVSSWGAAEGGGKRGVRGEGTGWGGGPELKMGGAGHGEGKQRAIDYEWYERGGPCEASHRQTLTALGSENTRRRGAGPH